MTSADSAKSHSVFANLSAPGVLGFFECFEATEIFAIAPGSSMPINVFSIFVATESEAPPPPQKFLTASPVTLPALPGWKFGISRYHVTVPALSDALDDLAAAASWRPFGAELSMGKMRAVPVQFVPPDCFRPVPWNRVLKNNFHGGSHVLEWVSSDAMRLGVLFANPKRLQQLADTVRAVVPLDLEGFSDRIGSLVVQFPVTIVMMGLERSSESGLFGELAWHPRATPRPLRVNCGFEFDRAVPGFASVDVTTGTFPLPARADRGTHRLFIWDPENHVLLAASGEAAFNNSIMINMQPVSPEPRVFSKSDGSGALIEHRVKVVDRSLSSLIGDRESDDTGGATRRRLYAENTERLAAERTFVQYKPEHGDTTTERKRGLTDLRKQINSHGRIGCWLWDPYLAADDILDTLFHCQFAGADLRALSAARTHRDN